MWDFTQPQIDQQILTNNAVTTLYIQFSDKKTRSVIVANFTFSRSFNAFIGLLEGGLHCLRKGKIALITRGNVRRKRYRLVRKSVFEQRRFI